ncbi:MAG: dicarboxylate/amino acid:cation symporter [Myxococcota bacterium]|nr:dicarboxylate/amino acid:cation symporter [Myxococcota bacterium]
MQLYTKILIGMLVGIVLGFLLGPNSSLLPQDGIDLRSGVKVYVTPGGAESPLAEKATSAQIVEAPSDKSQWLKIEFKLTPPDLLSLKSKGVDVAQIKPGESIFGFVKDGPKIKRFAPLGRDLVTWTEWIGRLFLAMIKMVVVPLVFFSLVVGVASLGDFKALGRLGGRTIGYFMCTTVAALIIGVGLANITQPGKLLSEADRANLLSSYGGSVGKTMESAAKAPSLVDQLVSIVPTNPISSLASGDMLQVIFFALMLGIALTMMKVERSQLVVDLFDRLNEAMVMLVHIAMLIAPYGVAALLFKVVGSTGLSVLLALAVYGIVVVVGLLIHLFGVYGTVIRLGAKLPLFAFLGAIKEALLVAFSTSSSSATLPVTMEACEDNVNCSNKITSFVLPLGATVNMDGTALYQGVAAIFIAQIYGMDLSVGDQATIVVSATLASVGAAGVPGAGMITLAMVLTSIGVPTEGLALILGVDRLLDMFRTMTNVVGDSAATVFMARLEGEDLRIMSDAEDARNPKKGFENRLDQAPQAVPVESED